MYISVIMMDLKLSSGLRVSVQENGNSKLLLFDKPVKAMELSQDESTRLGFTLMKGGRIGVTAELRKLIDSGFFTEPKSFTSIRTELFLKGIEAKATSLNMLLTKMIERGELTRTGRKGTYLYNKGE